MTETTAATEVPALPPTAAQRYWDENRERLEQAVEARKRDLTVSAEAMTTNDLRAALEAHNTEATDRYSQVKVPNKTAPKSEYVTAFVAAKMRGCDEEKAVHAARYAVSKEESVERNMQMLIAYRDAEVAKAREALADPDPAQAAAALAYRLEWHADSIMSATGAAQIAQQYLDRRAEGVEPAVLAMHIARQAIGVLAELPRSGSNLRVNSHGIAEVAKAAAQREVLGKVASLLDEDTQNLLNVWF